VGRAGFAKTPITPPLGTELAGYGVYLERRASEVHDDLFARTLALEDDAGERAAAQPRFSCRRTARRWVTPLFLERWL
jgi:hypothetical protein